MTFDDLAVALRALRLLAVDFSHLPAPDVDISPICPEELRLSFHDTSCDSFAAFEQWRTALQIASDTVDYRTQSGGKTRVLKAQGVFAGAVVALIAFADWPHACCAVAGQEGDAA
ncbi:hypothetical protein LUX01_11750 [Streptomyces sudanensis]|uniref:hypothetical protein n=1 Tax=Streptomyces sudanensis TaxID=436397 RepID=UPI0020CCAB52|nr:hypothetical protein [Streptomyces sudanensis]MCP9987264.1 hypothetical protein [Streptomyces sudanensis]